MKTSIRIYIKLVSLSLKICLKEASAFFQVFYIDRYMSYIHFAIPS